MIGKHVVIDTLDNFKTKLSLIPSSAIVLIKDVGQIYAHGTYFGAQKTYSLLTKTADGLAPKGGTSASSLIKDGESEWVLTVTNGENPTWRKLPANAFSSSLYTLPSATASDLGGIKVGQVYTATFNDLVGQYYKINVDKNGLAYVNVPWTNTVFTASGNGITMKDNVFSLSLNSTSKLDLAIGNKIYAVSLDKNGKLCVSVPWVDTNNIFTGATETKNGSSGMVPAPIANQHRYFLRGDGIWVKPNLSDLNDDVVNGKYVPLMEDSTINGWVNIVNTKVTEGTLQITSLSTKPRIRFEGDFSWGYLGFGGANNPCYYDNSLKEYNLIHSGNIGDQSVANAGALGGLVLANGNQTYNKVPYVAGDGVMEIGRYIDFHYTNNESNDRSTRLDCTGSYMNIVHLPSTSGTLALTTSNVASADYASSAGEASGLQINDSAKSETKLSFNATFIAKGDTTDFSWCSPTGSYTEGGTAGEWMGILRINMGNGTTKYYHDLSFDMNSKSPQWRQVVAGVSNGWRKFAFEDSNVESANKLKTARTIWGQSFDGTNNVTGNLNLGYNKIYIGDGSDNFYIGWGADNLYRYHNYYGHYFSAKDGEVMRINSSGNVGIGTASPSYKLHVKGKIYTSSNLDDGAGIILNQEKTTAGYNAIRFATNDTTYAAIHGFDEGFGGWSWTYKNLNLSSDIITLGPWNNPVIYITKNTTLTNSDGNVGIGTTSPAYKLDVNGTSRITASSRKTLTLNDTVGIGAYIAFQKGGTDSGGVGYSEGLGVFLSNNVSNTHIHLNADGLYYGHPTNGGVLFLHENNIGQHALLKAETLELAKSTESNAIYIVNNANSCITINSPSDGASIRKALQFNWYSDRWEIGNIRGSASYTAGFGITYGNDNLCFRVTTNGCYANGNKILTEAGGAINGNLSANLYSVTLNLLSGASSYTSSNPYTYTGTGDDSFVYLKNITCTLEAGCSYLVMCDTNYTWCSHDRQGETGYVSFWLRSNVDTSIHILCSTYTNHKNGCWGIVAPISGQYQVRFNTYKSGDTPQFYNMRIYKVPVGTSPNTVAWANKLLNSRTIWGLSFDGSGDISGSIDNCNWIRYYKGGSVSGYVVGRGEEITGGDGLGLWTYGNTPIFLGTGSKQRMTINSSGNVGIGTTSPAYKLDVNGNIHATTECVFDANIKCTYIYATKGESLFSALSGYTDPMPGVDAAVKISGRLGQSGGNALLCTTSGNVGIGTANPVHKLDVQGDGRFTSGLIANNLVLNGNILSGSSSYTKSNPYQLSGTGRDSYVYTSMTCYLEAGNTYLMTCESNYIFCEHDRQDLSGYAGIFLRCETDSSHIYACSYTKNNLGCAGSWGFYCGVTGTYTLRLNTYKSGDVAKFWNISIKKAPVPSIGGCTSWGGYSISVGSSAGTSASTIYFVV